ncbi:MAG: CatA-like O-acetyltransferase [Chloroflexi bacterium]|nr:CatA-like O-acetyltransferase [Chloroflexota bacterium]
MNFQVVDIAHWDRKSAYEFFMEKGTEMTLSVDLDITHFDQYRKEQDLRYFASFLYIVSRSLNEFTEFRTTLNRQKVPIVWGRIVPSFPARNHLDRMINTSCDYDPDFPVFYSRVLSALEKAYTQEANEFRESKPENYFLCSYVNVSFHQAGIMSTKKMLDVPSLFWGKSFLVGDQVRLPFSITFHHAFADMGHFVQLFERIESYCSRPAEILKLS